MYDLSRTEDLTKYTVIDDEGNVIAVYSNKFKAKDHVDALNSGTDYIEKPNSYYDALG
jgi:DNA-binding response OmpR family regulator